QYVLRQVGLVDSREASHDDRGGTEKARREGGMLAARAFTVVRVADDHPLDALGLVVAGDRREGLSRLPGEDILALAGLARVGVGRAHEHVVAELVEVSAVAKPRARGREVIGRGLALALQ